MGKKKRKQECPEMPPWMITFSDVMTLMLTFFVLLVSMSRIDERRKLVVLGSIIGAFGLDNSYDLMAIRNTKRTVEPGVFQDIEDLMPLKPMLWENVDLDLRFESTRFVQTLSIPTEVLFEAGSSVLSGGGRDLLDSMLPVLTEVDYPLLVAGHTASLRDELGAAYKAGDLDEVPDLTWKLSLDRSLAVYQHLIQGGVSPDNLRLEAFGRFSPHYNNSDPHERLRNRRVDIVLDKRSQRFAQLIEEEAKAAEVRDDTYEVEGFIFRLDGEPGRNTVREPVREPVAEPAAEPQPGPGQ